MVDILAESRENLSILRVMAFWELEVTRNNLAQLLHFVMREPKPRSAM